MVKDQRAYNSIKRFEVGEKVFMKQSLDKKWKTGFVTSLRPLRVRHANWFNRNSYQWDLVSAPHKFKEKDVIQVTAVFNTDSQSRHIALKIGVQLKVKLVFYDGWLLVNTLNDTWDYDRYISPINYSRLKIYQEASFVEQSHPYPESIARFRSAQNKKNKNYEVGDIVEVRNHHEYKFQRGVVTQLNPIKVKTDAYRRAVVWEIIEPIKNSVKLAATDYNSELRYRKIKKVFLRKMKHAKKKNLDEIMNKNSTKLYCDKIIAFEITFALYLMVGIAFFMWFKIPEESGMSYSQALYTVVTIFTTVGYGLPAHYAERENEKITDGIIHLFLTFYIIWGVGVIMTAISISTDVFFEDVESGKYVDIHRNHYVGQEGVIVDIRQGNKKKNCFWTMLTYIYTSRLTEFLLWFFIMIGGSIIIQKYGLHDKYAYSVFDFEFYTHALYFGIVTCSSVGFGDFEPSNDFGFIFTSFWIIIVIIITETIFTRVYYYAVGTAIDLHVQSLLDLNREILEVLSYSDSQFALLDINGDGYVDEYQFIIQILINACEIEYDMVRIIKKHFKEFDLDDDGRLSIDKFYRKKNEAPIQEEKLYLDQNQKITDQSSCCNPRVLIGALIFIFLLLFGILDVKVKPYYYSNKCRNIIDDKKFQFDTTNRDILYCQYIDKTDEKYYHIGQCSASIYIFKKRVDQDAANNVIKFCKYDAEEKLNAKINEKISLAEYKKSANEVVCRALMIKFDGILSEEKFSYKDLSENDINRLKLSFPWKVPKF